MIAENNSAARDFLARRHAELAVDAGLIEPVLSELGIESVSVEPVIAGDSNAVFRVESNNGRFFVRAKPAALRRYEFEAEVLRRAADVEVPVPEVLDVREVLDGDRRVAVMVMTSVDGSELGYATPEFCLRHRGNLDQILESLGKALTNLHAIDPWIDGYGDLGDEKRDVSWSKHLRDTVSRGLRRITGVHAAGELVDFGQATLQATYEKAGSLDSARRALIHRDLGANHVFANDIAVTGLIDFEDASGGDGLWDLAAWSIWCGPDGLAPVLRTYEQAVLGGEDTRERFRVTRDAIATSAIGFYLANQAPDIAKAVWDNYQATQHHVDYFA